MEYHRQQGSDENMDDTVRLLGPAENDCDGEHFSADVKRSYHLSQNMHELLNTTMSTCEEHHIDVDNYVSTVNVNSPTPKGKPTMYLLVAAAMAALGGVLFGYDIGIMSGALLQLKEEFSLSCFQQELVVSSLLIGATIGSILGGFLLDNLGRRKAIIVNSMVFIMGAIVLSASTSYPVLILGRLIVGFAVSLSAIGECIYISEISPKERRGQLVSINELGITLGLLLAYLVNFCFIKVTSGWRYMFAISGLPALCQGIGMFFLPPSPRFLVQQKHYQSAKKVLTMLRGSENITDELSAIQTSVSLERNYSFLHLFQSVDNMRWRIGIGAALVFFQQITGQTNVVYYAPTVLENLGFEDNVSATVATLGVGIIKVITTCICLMLVDKFGRRYFLLFGSGLMALFIIILGIITQAIPTTIANDACQATSLSAESPSVNSTLYIRHERSKENIFGRKAGKESNLFPMNFESHSGISHHADYISQDRATIFSNMPFKFRRKLQSFSNKNERKKDVTHRLKTTPSDFGRTYPHGAFQTKNVSSRMQWHLESISSVNLMHSNRIREKHNIHPSTQEGSLRSPFQDASSDDRLSDLALPDIAPKEHSTVSPERTESSIDTGSMLDKNEANSEDHIAGSAKWSALVLLLLYVGAYSFGFGPITWLVISEIFPAGIRGRASSLTLVFNWGTNVVISLTFLDVIRKFGVSWTFLTYGLVCSVSAVFIYLAIPETKNRSLEQISEGLSKKRSSFGESCTTRCLPCDYCLHSATRYRPTLLITDDTTL